MINTTSNKSYLRITVVSWESDGTVRTKVEDLLDDTTIHMVCDMLSHMKYNAGDNATDQFGNMYKPDNSKLVAFATCMKQIVKKYVQRGYEIFGDIDDIDDIALAEIFADFLAEFLDVGNSVFTRSCEKITVERVHVDSTLTTDITKYYI